MYKRAIMVSNNKEEHTVYFPYETKEDHLGYKMLLKQLAQDGASLKDEVEVDRITYITGFMNDVINQSIKLLLSSEHDFFAQLMLGELLDAPMHIVAEFIEQIETEKLEVEIPEILRQIVDGKVNKDLLHTEAAKRNIVLPTKEKKSRGLFDDDFAMGENPADDNEEPGDFKELLKRLLGGHEENCDECDRKDCPSDSTGCQPCDNGMPCDSCQYDRGLKLKNALDEERLGLPLTPECKELLDEHRKQLIKEGEEDQAKKSFYED